MPPVPKGADPATYDRCVGHVKARSGRKVNPYAVCAASVKRKGRKARRGRRS